MDGSYTSILCLCNLDFVLLCVCMLTLVVYLISFRYLLNIAFRNLNYIILMHLDLVVQRNMVYDHTNRYYV